MCLDTVLRRKEKKVALVKLPDTITVWKVLLKPGWDKGENNTCYVTDWFLFPVYAGEIKFTQLHLKGFVDCLSYRGGGHFWLTKKGAEDWMGSHKNTEKIARCTVKKSNINAIGSQNDFPVVVVKKATFPKYIGEKTQ